MKQIGLSILAGAGLAAVAASLAGVAGASTYEPNAPGPFTGSAPDPSGDNPQIVINRLTANGYKVILNKFGAAPLDQCKVASTTPGQPIQTMVSSGTPGMNWNTVYTTIFLTVDCTSPMKGH